MLLGLLSSTHDFGRDDWLSLARSGIGAGAVREPGGLDGTAPGHADRAGMDRVEIEIGPGNCGYLKAAALLAPRCLHVGIEIQPASLERARRGGPLPSNLRLLEGDGGWIVRHLLAPASVDAFHVYFPDPWWKKRHHKRRLFQSDFCEILLRTVVPGGSVHVVTDVVPLFAEIRERMVGAGFVVEPWERTSSDVACSSYERKYRQQGRRFEQASFRRSAG
jgi:tRNA (guanine-N7-)-methyltransferase